MTKFSKRFVTMALATAMAASVGMLAACGDNPTTVPPTTDVPTSDAPQTPATYTYRYAMSEIPTGWNPHTYQTATDAEILNYVSEGFYTFDYNDTLDGYKVVPAMASDFPIDVTAQYIGQYGLEEGAADRAYEIPLRSNLEWDDGTPINAQSFVDSLQRLLNPIAKNYRADSVYSSSFVIHNAKNYLYQGSDAWTTACDASFTEYITPVLGEDGFWHNGSADGEIIYIKLTQPSLWSTKNSLQDYVDNGYMAEEDVPTFNEYSAKANADGAVPADETIATIVKNFCAAVGGGYEEEWLEFSGYYMPMPELDFEEVGIKALPNGNLLLVLDKPLSGFYLNYNLSSSWLVHTELYDSLSKVVDGVYSSTYGTSVETTRSYSAYKLTNFVLDKEFALAKNENWYGYDLPENEGLYQTTNITVQAVGEASTRLQMFLRGELDAYGLTADDMADYQMSDYTYYTKGESTFAMVFNPNKSALEAEQAKDGANINKTIITLKDFRMAMSLGLDRAAFCLATSPVNSAAFGLYSSLIISDPESGEAYRTTEGAKDALLNFWGLADDVGEGKLYETKEDASDAITGYDLATAKVLFDKAYDEAIATGLMDEDDVVLITIGTPNMTTKFYNSGYDYLVKNYTEAVKGTKLEGKLTFERDGNLGGSDFAKALQTNQVDMLFGVGWTGSALDPYGLIEAYTSPNYQYDPSYDTSAAMCDVVLDGKVLRASLWDWTMALAGETILATVVVDGEETEDVVEVEAGTSAAYETRLTILSAMENAILGQYDFIPMMDESSAALKGMKIKYYTEEYVYGVGRGGIKYMSYNYSDAEWTAFVAAQGGELLYK